MMQIRRVVEDFVPFSTSCCYLYTTLDLEFTLKLYCRHCKLESSNLKLSSTITMTRQVERLRSSQKRRRTIRLALDRLDQLRCRGHLRSGERRTILRVFDTLRDQAETPRDKESNSPRIQTARLCDVSSVTVQRLVTK